MPPRPPEPAPADRSNNDPPWLNRLSGFQRALPGREWVIWRRLPVILTWGTLLPLLVAWLYWVFEPSQPSPAQARDQLLVYFRLIGLVVLHWTLVLTVGIGCVIVMLMKGPAYVADAYPPPERRDAP
jgi:hypothetical protein